jgi:hypothetical protein
VTYIRDATEGCYFDTKYKDKDIQIGLE